ncbi:ficolin-1-like [Drosophila madeirensis]|uniref:Ficolin-1-like n=1 Tax=Drosophila madeirensis TaxID=30013 RepID=A0AAU9FJ42_DROMD
MQATWVHWLLVLFLCKSTGLAVEASVVNGAESGDSKSLNGRSSYSQCPFDVRAHGIYTVILPILDPFQVFCDAKMAGPGWLVIARRTTGELNFYRNWAEYKRGFGDLAGEFFIGLDKLHAITKSQTHQLYVHIEDYEGNKRYAKYDEFLIGSENEAYQLSKLGAFTGDAGDSMAICRNQKFSTYDRDNDAWKDGSCAHIRIGPWWHRTYQDNYSSLFGLYVVGTVPGLDWKGMMWQTFKQNYSHKKMQMMVRPK